MPRIASGRPLLRTLADGTIFLLLLVMVMLAARQAGYFAPETGRFEAIDGDSLRKDGKEYRLHAIDAPELRQTCTNAAGRSYACGIEAQKALRRLARSGPLDCRIIESDRYGRLVADCVHGSENINREMVRQGWAIAYRRHGLAYVAAEEEARTAARGLWQGSFERPEDWRARHRDGLARGALGDAPGIED